MTPNIDVYIQLETEINRQYLLGLVKNTELGINTNVVYIYSLADEHVNYPNKNGHVIYIGEAGRPSEPTAKRFSQHISTGPNTGGDTGTIYSLSRYYWQKKRIRLQIFFVENKESRKRTEREFLNVHVKEFGALPICQGTTGENYGTTMLSNLIVSQEQLNCFLPVSNKALQLAPSALDSL
jgi:hypothetical protein